MATYKVVNSRRTVQVVSPTQVQDVMVLGVITSPSGVYFERPVPLKDWLANPFGPGFYLQPPTDNIEGAMTNPEVIAASYIEDLGSNGLVEGFIQFVFEVPSNDPTRPGPFQATADVPMSEVAAGSLAGGGMISAEFNNTLAALQQLAG